MVLMDVIPQFPDECRLVVGFIFLLVLDAVHDRDYQFCQFTDLPTSPCASAY